MDRLPLLVALAHLANPNLPPHLRGEIEEELNHGWHRPCNPLVLETCEP